MSSESYQVQTYAVPLECRYLLSEPVKRDRESLQFITLHGYGSNPHDMLRLTRMAVGSGHVIASLQAPNQHYAAPPGMDAPAGYNWGVRHHWEASVALHHSMLKMALERLFDQFHIGPERTVLMGFSQPVGLNYRFVGTEPGHFGGVIGVCGGVPRDWAEPKYQPVSAPILDISRDEDEFYPAGTARQFPAKLRAHAADVEFHLLPGGHRFPSKAGSIIQPWLRRVFGGLPV